MKNPFEDFLEDALGGPEDLELGHEMRRRLLEAAVAGESVPDENVVRMERPDPEEAEGFDWLLGEAPASEKLMVRMIQDPLFLDSLDGQRGFVVALREALRRTAAATALPSRRRRWLPAAILSAAAALAVTTGLVLFKPTADTPELTAEVVAAPAVEVPVLRPPAKAITALVDSPETEDSSEPTPFASEIAGASPPALADLGGTGRSVELDDPALLPELAGALQLPGEESSMPAPLLAMLRERGVVSGGSSESDDGSLLLARGPSFPHVGGFGGFGFGGDGLGIALTGPGRGGGGKDGSIPEPGGALPVMIGFMVLLLRRPRRQKRGD